MTSTSLPESRRLLFIGDSITDCSRTEDPDGLGYGYVRLLAEHFAAHEPTARVVNRGISGNKVDDLVGRFAPDCLEHDPQVVTIYVGVNDAWHRFTQGEGQRVSPQEFEEGYRFLLDQLSATRPAAPVLMVLPVAVDVSEEIARIHEDLDEKVRIIRDLAREFQHPVVDLEDMLQRAWAVGHTPPSIAEDGVHPTIAGHRLIADEWLATFAGVDPAGR
ncbi:MAG: GDSL-type esterase/lipase family protein [Brachybacterium sp.]|uniref:SGNH/GDSL hydrolase family protein n=1 Tax=Brachybacterium sp. TaxID=1891286 RepID=UPI0026479794|nr:GDSL-type esterase/lipase family protein [Brachybacterium sp.]MDN5688142.1 GDSL-type esterase/lipase family protein [Brachybacterium sp.]